MKKFIPNEFDIRNHITEDYDFRVKEYILVACKAHEALVEALKNQLEAFKAFTNVRDGDIVEQSEAALKLARKE